MALKRGAVATAVLTTAVFAGPAHHHHPTQQRLHYGSSQGNYDVQYLSTAAQRNALAGVDTQACATAATSTHSSTAAQTSDELNNITGGDCATMRSGAGCLEHSLRLRSSRSSRVTAASPCLDDDTMSRQPGPAAQGDLGWCGADRGSLEPNARRGHGAGEAAAATAWQPKRVTVELGCASPTPTRATPTCSSTAAQTSDGVDEGVDAAGEQGEARRRGAPLAGMANSSPVETPSGSPATSCGRV